MMNVVLGRGRPWASISLALAVLASLSPHGAALSVRDDPPLKDMMPWYHSADEIASMARSLASSCGGGASLEVSQRSQINVGGDAGAQVDIDVVHVSKNSGGDGSKLRALLVFGEHARELISPESALNLLQTLCGSGPEAERASAVLDKVSFTIVPNANPLSRKLVEEGHYCRRTNEDGVDLNRNFGDNHRNSAEVPGSETNPGPSGFSEPESKIIKALIDEERPDIYVSVHSGAYLLGTPFGYKRGLSPATEASMMEVLGPISEKYCGGECPYGNLAELINYENPGCDIDYVAEAGTPYTFTWEIYTGEDFRGRYIEQARARREASGLNLLQRAGRRARRQQKAAFRGLAARTPDGDMVAAAAMDMGPAMHTVKPEGSQRSSDCLSQFVPRSEDETHAVVGRWTGAYLELAERVAAKKTRGPALPSA